MKFLIYFFLPCFLLGAPFETFTLDNGMTVIMKQTDNKDEDVVFELLAKGGWYFLPQKDQISGRLTAGAVWEAGFGEYTSDQISNILYEESADLFLEIEPFYRKIAGSSPKENLEEIFKLINLIFTKPRFHAINLKPEMIKKWNCIECSDLEAPIDEHVKLLNTQNFPAFQPLKEKDLAFAKSGVIEEFYKKSFQAPSDFVLVVVGSFDKDKAKSLIVSNLGVIPKKETAPLFKETLTPPPFPSKIKTEILPSKFRSDSLTRISFPIKVEINESNIKDLVILTHLMEEHLRNTLKQQTSKTHGIDVSYELPFYPYLKGAWLSIQFHSDYSSSDFLTKKIFSGIRGLSEQKQSKNEMAAVNNQIMRLENFWNTENIYWLSKLINSHIFQFDSDSLEIDPASDYNQKDIRDLLYKYFDFSVYTKLITKPS